MSYYDDVDDDDNNSVLDDDDDDDDGYDAVFTLDRFAHLFTYSHSSTLLQRASLQGLGKGFAKGSGDGSKVTIVVKWPDLAVRKMHVLMFIHCQCHVHQCQCHALTDNVLPENPD